MLEEWCHNAYLNGMKELYQSRNRKWHLAFWIVIMTVMIGSSIYFVIKVLTEYIFSPTVTRVATIPSSSLEMPEIMVCFNGGLNASALLTENFSNELIYVLNGAVPLGVITFENMTRTKYELDSYLRINNLTVDQLYKKFSYACTDMVEYLYGASSDRDFPNRACSSIWSTDYISPVYGRCLIYRNNSLQFWPGLNGGVRAILKFPPNSVAERFPIESLSLCDKTMSYAISLEKKFRIQTERFILIPPNVKVEIVLNTKHYVRLPEGETGCNRDSDNNNLCSGRCYADAVYLGCGCVPFKYYEPDYHQGKQICTPFDEYSCTSYAQYSVPCQEACTPPCDEWVFESTFSYGTVATSAASNNDIFSTQVPQTSMWIGYETLQYTQVTFSNF